MPELPEVETVKETLKKKILNKKVEDVKIYYNGIIATDLKEFEKIKNQTFLDIKRRGKWIVFELNDHYLLSHLRMEGKYHLKEKKEELKKHEHISFVLNNNKELRYMDTRKFGKMHLIKKDEINKSPLFLLGPEPEDLTYKYLKEKFSKKTIPIKTAILDQTILVGIGNIYADEILFLSKINPFRKTSSLKKNEIEAIIKNTKLVLDKATKLGGTTIRSYTSDEGISGKFQNELYVHGKEGEQCSSCSDIIKKTRIGGRGTYYCEKCQK